MGDSSGIKNAYNQVKWDVFQVLSEIVDRLRGITPQIIFVDGYSGGNEDINELVKKKRLGRVNLNNCNYHDLYHVLEGASLFISGRGHAFYVHWQTLPYYCGGQTVIRPNLFTLY